MTTIIPDHYRGVNNSDEIRTRRILDAPCIGLFASNLKPSKHQVACSSHAGVASKTQTIPILSPVFKPKFDALLKPRDSQKTPVLTRFSHSDSDLIRTWTARIWGVAAWIGRVFAALRKRPCRLTAMSFCSCPNCISGLTCFSKLIGGKQ
jgi:hypothetical protein